MRTFDRFSSRPGAHVRPEQRRKAACVRSPFSAALARPAESPPCAAGWPAFHARLFRPPSGLAHRMTHACCCSRDATASRHRARLHSARAGVTRVRSVARSPRTSAVESSCCGPEPTGRRAQRASDVLAEQLTSAASTDPLHVVRSLDAKIWMKIARERVDLIVVKMWRVVNTCAGAHCRRIHHRREHHAK